MSRRVRRLVTELSLPEVEASYLFQVAHQGRGLPRSIRGELLDDAAEMLAERPAAADPRDLEDSVGSAAELVESFRSENGWEGPIGPIRRVGSVRRWVRWTVPIVLLVLAGLGVATYRYFTATPEFSSSCGGVVATDVEQLEAGDTTEYVVGYRQDERLGLYTCVGTQTDGVTIVELARPTAPNGAFQPVGFEVDADDPGEVDLRGDASRRTPYDATEGYLVNAVLWYEMEYCVIEGGIGFDDLHVTYRYRGRTRTTTIPLGYTVTVWAEGLCTDDVRDEIQRASQAWGLITGPRLFPREEPLDALEPYGLFPESVSRDLCRYLRGVIPASPGPQPLFTEFEPLESRAVFLIEDRDLAEILIDGAVMGICPDFEARRDDLVALLDR